MVQKYECISAIYDFVPGDICSIYPLQIAYDYSGNPATIYQIEAVKEVYVHGLINCSTHMAIVPLNDLGKFFIPVNSITKQDVAKEWAEALGIKLKS